MCSIQGERKIKLQTTAALAVGSEVVVNMSGYMQVKGVQNSLRSQAETSKQVARTSGHIKSVHGNGS